MSKTKIGEKLNIHGYKHDKQIYRSSDEAVVLEINDDYLVVGNNNTILTKYDGRAWRTKEPAIIYFYKDKWYNIICQLKEKGLYYYCNIATPYVIDDKTIKYIDYDLDLRVFPDGSYKVLDKGEYEHHRKKMKYSKEIDIIVKAELDNLIEKLRHKEEPFDGFKVHYYYSKYLEKVSKR